MDMIREQFVTHVTSTVRYVFWISDYVSSDLDARFFKHHYE